MKEIWRHQIDKKIHQGFQPLYRAFAKVMDDLNSVSPRENTTYSPHPVYDNYGELISKSVAKEKLELSNEYDYILFLV